MRKTQSIGLVKKFNYNFSCVPLERKDHFSRGGVNLNSN